jgi:hypothetical protein
MTSFITKLNIPDSVTRKYIIFQWKESKIKTILCIKSE